VTVSLTENERKRIESLVEFFQSELQSEFPMRIHSREIDDGSAWGAPAFHPEFMRWLSIKELPAGERPDGRTRITRVLRKVRKESPSEWFVTQLVVLNGLSIKQVVARKAARESARGSDIRWTEEQVLLLLMGGLDKCYKWYDV
jgi:hypothetical protein